MRVATFSIAGERRVGLVDLDNETVAPFDLAGRAGGVRRACADRAQRRRPAAHPLPDPAGAGDARSADPACRAATSSASARTITSMRTSSPRAASIPAPPPARCRSTRSSFPRCPRRSSPTMPSVLIDHSGLDGHRLRGRACRDHRQGRPRHLARERPRSCLGLHHRQRRDGARPAGPLQPVADRQVAGHVLPDGTLGGDQGRDRPRRHAAIRCFVNGELRQDSEYRAADLRHPDHHRHAVAGHHAQARRHHRHRHAGRRRHRLRSAEISEGRRRRADRDRRHRRAGKPVRGARRDDDRHGRRSRRGGRRRGLSRRDDPWPRRHVEHVPAADGGARRLSRHPARPAGLRPLAAAASSRCRSTR